MLWTTAVPLGLSAQTDSLSSDSTHLYELPPVTITAESLLNDVAESARPTSVIDEDRIRASAAQDLADAVSHAPGVFIRRYGGLGGLRTVSLRGTSSQQIVLFIDGVRYRSSTESGFDFGNIPAAALDRVEVVRGGDAMLFGANSLGGAINVVTGGAPSGNLHLSTTLAAGSFGERSAGITGVMKTGLHTFDAGFHGTESEGDYSFPFNEFGDVREVKRENGDFGNLFGRVGWKYRPESGWKFGGSAQGYATGRGVPGAVVQGSREQLHARLDEKDLFLTGQAERPVGRWLFSAAGSARLNRLRYVDPDAGLNGPDGIDNSYDRTVANVNGKVLWFPDDATSLTGIVETEYSRLVGDNLDPSVGDIVHRVEYGIGLRGSHRFVDDWFGKELKVDAGLRLDLFSDLDPQAAPSAGLVWQPFAEPLRLRAHFARNFRVPSFNEQYYLNFGNADLDVETSRSIDVGATWEADRSVVFEAGLFTIDSRDLIVSIPRSPVSWSAQNVGHVVSRGVEFGGLGSLFDGVLDAQTSYTLMEAVDRSGGITDGHLLPYAPQELFNGILSLNRWGLTLSGSWEYVSHRQTLSYNTPESALPHYLLINSGLAGRSDVGRFELSARLNVLNVFDEKYQVVRNYPMPGRSLRVEISVGWNGRE